MPSSLSFIGADFRLQSVEPRGLASLRLRFTQDPLAADPAGAHDGLNPSQYSLGGPTANHVTVVSHVNDDPQSLDLSLAAPLDRGTWTLTASSNLETATGRLLQAPLTLSFEVTFTATQAPVTGGAENDSAEHVLRKHLGPGLKGKAWDALIAALAVGDKFNWDLAKAAFDQLFKSTASGLYLDRKCGDDGVARPAGVGMSDDLYRQLSIKLTAAKLTPEVLLEILEVFYGSDSLRAYVETEAQEPFQLNDGDTLEVFANEREVLPVTFRSQEFEVIYSASALEVAVALTRQFRLSRSTAFAVAVKDPETNTSRVRIYSGALGLASSMRVRGGSAQKALRFDDQVSVNTDGLDPSELAWDVTIPEAGRVRMTIRTQGPTLWDGLMDLSSVEAGDYVLVTGPAFDPANRGTFTILSMDVRYEDGGTVRVQTLEFANEGVVQSGVPQEQLDGVLFFRPTKKMIHAGGARTVVLAQTQEGRLDVVVPATTQTVSRTPENAAYPGGSKGPYLMDKDGLAITAVETTTTENLFKGSQYGILNVTDASAFPDKEGRLVIGFGTDTAAYPIRYLGRYSDTALILDYRQKMPATNLAGAGVTLLADSAAQAQEAGLFYLTASGAGRLAAEDHLRRAAAAGLDLHLEVVYPGDRGLGGEGLGAVGRKCSDKVAIWGGDDLDAEVSQARGKD